jgi:phenylalanyl-tRNA synthetase beta chain
MKLSLEWLGHYVDLHGLSPEQIAHRLTMATAEVEGVETLRRSVRGIVVGEVAASEPIDTGDASKPMQYVTVRAGSIAYHTVCGAPNVRVGMKSAFAAPGTVIAEGHEIHEQRVFGRMSEGILCSPRELGWGESHAGIMAFHDSLAAGTELEGIVPETDFLIEIDNKSITHRPDLWGHYGFSRELAAIFGKELKPLDVIDAAEGSDLFGFPLRIEDAEGCPGYCCVDIDGLRPAFSPMYMQYRLLSVGLRPINLLVDLTNYIMCELGQPMHAFDGERVRDIVVAPFGKKGTFRTLDSVERSMNSDDLMICDHGGPIALAGIMGGEDSEIRENTSRVLLESANFHPARIRRTSLRLGLRTDAGARFEKGQPPFHMMLSLRRFVRLLREAGQTPVLRSRLTAGGETGEKGRPLSMTRESLDRSIGMKIPDERIAGILTSLGFACSIDNKGAMEVVIPPHRSVRDIPTPRDIVEEVARIYGYDNIIPAMPSVDLRAYSFNEELRTQHKLRRFLSQAKGFAEAHTYSWYDENWLRRIGYDPGETLRLKNPAAENNARLRLELIPNLLALAEANVLHRDSFSFYEMGNVYLPEGGGCRQVLHAGGVSCRSEKGGSLQDLFLEMKGSVEEIAAMANGAGIRFTPSSDTSKPWYGAGSCLEIRSGEREAGKLGMLDGPMLDVFEKGTRVVWFELDVGALRGPSYPEIGFEEIPVYPGSWMDFSILADAAIPFAELEERIGAFTHPILKTMRHLYLYRGKGLPEGTLSYTFRFWLGLRERTLTGDDLTAFRESFLRHISGLGLSLR